MSVKFLSAILGPEMAAPILWTPRISVFFLQENLHVHKIPRFRGGVFWVGGGSADFIFMGAGISLRTTKTVILERGGRLLTLCGPHIDL